MIGRFNKVIRPGRDPAWLAFQEMGPLTCSFVCTRGYADCTVLAVRGELDITAVAELSAQLLAAMSGESRVIVDLADVAYLDCSSLGVLAGARGARPAGRR